MRIVGFGTKEGKKFFTVVRVDKIKYPAKCIKIYLPSEEFAHVLDVYRVSDKFKFIYDDGQNYVAIIGDKAYITSKGEEG